MRTHLLHTVTAVTPDANSDHGTAANDDGVVSNRSTPLLMFAPRCMPSEETEGSATNHDDDYLGGYAGI